VRDNLAVAAHARAAADGFDRGLGSSLAHAGVAFEAERQMRGIRQRLLQLRGDAVGRHDIEADAGTQHDLRTMRLVFDAVRQLEDFDLTGDVEIVNVRGETALHHRPCRRGERSRAMQDSSHAIECTNQRGVIVEREHCALATELGCELLDFLPRATGERGPHAAGNRLACDQFPGVAVRPMEQPTIGHDPAGCAANSTRLFWAAILFQSPAVTFASWSPRGYGTAGLRPSCSTSTRSCSLLS